MKRYFVIIMIACAAMACREKYIPEFETPATGFLVVEGNITSGDTTTILLSRSNTLAAQGFVPEQNASMRIEGSDNSRYPLANTGSGQYRTILPNLNPSLQYRLRIFTRDGSEYASAFTPLKITPPVDSISWAREKEDGVQMYVNAHDDNNNSKYYLWQYLETWEFKSSFLPDLRFVDTDPNRVYVDTMTPDLSRYTCWSSRSFNQILIGTTVNLSRDRVYQPIKFVPRTAKEMSVLYSINVKQYVLSKEAYEFYEKLKRNTETTGSIFDAQPSEITGNIKSITRPDELVVGYINASTVTQKRLFIYNSQLPGWNYRSGCTVDEIRNHPDSVQVAYNGGALAVTPSEQSPSGAILRLFVAYNRTCVDCRLTGTNVKPVFWP